MKPRALIIDGHVGCQLWQKAAVEAAGAEATVLSLRRRTEPVAFPMTAAEARLNKRLKFLWWRVPPRRRWSAAKSKLLDVAGANDLNEAIGAADMLLGAYPPNVAPLLVDLARRFDKRVVLNLAHRCTWEGAPGDGKKADAFAALLRELHADAKHTLAAMGEYDYQYAAHYLDVAPVKLYTACHHMPLQRHRPAVDTVLVGPSRPPHSPHLDTGPFASTADINARHRRWCAQNGKAKSLHFAEIRRLYPRYELADLARHAAVVVFPYSAYSISMAELYEMNMPFFVPSAEVLLAHRMPRELWSSPPPPAASASAATAHDALAHWLQFSYFYQAQNAVVWDSPDDLFRKLNEYDFADLSARMYHENKTRREESLRRWAEVLGSR